MIDNTLTWKIHTLKVIPKLIVACFSLRAIKSFVMQDTSKMVYHSYFLSIINYGIICWGNPPIVIVFSNYKRELLTLAWV